MGAAISAGLAEVGGGGFTDVVVDGLEDGGFFCGGEDGGGFASGLEKSFNCGVAEEVGLVDEGVTHQVVGDGSAVGQEGEVDDDCGDNDDES